MIVQHILLEITIFLHNLFLCSLTVLFLLYHIYFHKTCIMIIFGKCKTFIVIFINMNMKKIHTSTYSYINQSLKRYGNWNNP